MERIDQAFASQRRFVADAAHELRTPLTIIEGELELAQDQAGRTASRSIAIALDETEHLSELGERLLAMARLDAGGDRVGHRSVRLDELVVECVQRTKRNADKKNVRVQVRIDDAVELQGDREQLRSMIFNVLDNAVKYSAPGSPVDITLAHTDITAIITVSDQGPGIPEKDIPHIYERFYRAEAVRSKEIGSGLGLAIVEQVARLHGGTIKLETTIGKGTTFQVTLPIATQ